MAAYKPHTNISSWMLDEKINVIGTSSYSRVVKELWQCKQILSYSSVLKCQLLLLRNEEIKWEFLESTCKGIFRLPHS